MDSDKVVEGANIDVNGPVSEDDRREAERQIRQAKRRSMFARIAETQPSEHLEDTGAPPGSHEKKTKDRRT